MRAGFGEIAGNPDVESGSSDTTNEVTHKPRTELPSASEPGAAKSYRCALVLVTLGVVALFSFVILLASSHRRTDVRAQLCNTEDCRAHAKLLTEHLDWTLDPCEDFQAFVCSAAPHSSERSDLLKTVFDGLRLSWFQGLRGMLHGGSRKLPIGKKALTMYEMCLDQYPSDKPDLPFFLSFIRFLGMNWPESPRYFEPPLEFVIKLAYLWHSPFWVSVRVFETPDHSLSTARQRIQIRPSALVPTLLHHHVIVESVYTTYWKQFLVHMYPDERTRPAMNNAAVYEVRNMEKYILETFKSLDNAAVPRQAVFSFGNIPAHVPNASAPEWLRSFQVSLLLRRELTFDDEIVVSDVRLLQRVSELLNKYDVAQLNMHLTWLIVQYHSAAAGYPMLIDYYGSQGKAALRLPVYCGHQLEASFKVLVAALDFVFRFTARDIKTVNNGFNDVVSAAVKKVNASDWMDDESKARLSEKILAVKKSLWPPKAIVNADLLQKLYGEFPEDTRSFAALWMGTRVAASQVTMTGPYLKTMRLPWNSLPGYAFYDYVSNVVELATATIAAPLYYPNGTKAMLYGGLLFLVATHLVRAFDSEGLRWTPNGTEVHSILSNATLSEYRDRERCLYGDREQSIFPEAPAVAIAYEAMKLSHVRDGSEPLALRDDLSEDKVFFMTLCYISCDISGDHRSPDFDCNKVARNSRAFAEAFHCAAGSKMNAKKKCEFFFG
ncbi:endothelin-converting enzyme 1-like [Dermacentor andersoni]|uniref:endothelin-converting enzyme 1-like n=1 Tax=Dermacentor andersoni TaxID=34620 RepID=UPI0024166296|nr:endothelin-converting enzyme 1-like [Dermacentor andersoni]